MRLILITGVLSVALATSLGAFAEQAPRGSTARTTPPQERERIMLERYDANDDGVIDPDERQAMREAIGAEMAALRKKIDAGRAPRTSRSIELERRLRARGAEILRQYDIDRDGQLSAAERVPFDASLAALRRQQLARYDTNGNGRIDPGERPKRQR